MTWTRENVGIVALHIATSSTQMKTPLTLSFLLPQWRLIDPLFLEDIPGMAPRAAAMALMHTARIHRTIEIADHTPVGHPLLAIALRRKKPSVLAHSGICLQTCTISRGKIKRSSPILNHLACDLLRQGITTQDPHPRSRACHRVRVDNTCHHCLLNKRRSRIALGQVQWCHTGDTSLNNSNIPTSQGVIEIINPDEDIQVAKAATRPRRTRRLLAPTSRRESVSALRRRD